MVPTKPKPATTTTPAGQRLYEQARRQREKQQQRAADLLKAECPFSPKLVAKPVGATARAASPAVRAPQGQGQGKPAPTPSSFVQRQMEYQRKMEARLQERQRAEQEKREAELLFRPKINPVRSTTPVRFVLWLFPYVNVGLLTQVSY